MTKITGLWKNTNKKGETYLSGSLTPISKILIMANDYKKEGDKSPDYFMHIVENEKKDGGFKKTKQTDL